MANQSERRPIIHPNHFAPILHCSGSLGIAVILYTPELRGYTDYTDFTESHGFFLKNPRNSVKSV